ncbi:hypothetical protein EPUS_06011 [Endocarpon pusillum Z07020]|uniref:mRNA stability protein n=1 Tax=Endocarpon pusillum (strain Z07020 / HMAS-L-300199) TaxID=1263415 RepID=U1G1R4_ENDPU|nr:uncharacterized protein EPUS_06011 [Endocarpon pusillum Z07020]ERF71182.1 hypothetical protein EPUS_06011 [Endocarpon pusillum Z07020]
MNPHQKNKVDISSLSADEQRLFRLYGKLPNKKDLLQNKLKERKYFDSGDYALSKAGKASDTGVTTIGTEHPQAENIPHLSASSPPNSANSLNSPSSATIPHTGSMSGGDRDAWSWLAAAGHRRSVQGVHGATVGISGGQSRSPVKESSYLARTASADEVDGEEETADQDGGEGNGEEALLQQGMSISPPVVQEGLPIRR